MDGIRGYRSWRWIFILEGIVTILVGIAAFFFVTDFPTEARWLTENERRHLIEQSRSESDKVRNVTLRDLVHFFMSPRRILGGLIYFGKHVHVISLRVRWLMC